MDHLQHHQHHQQQQQQPLVGHHGGAALMGAITAAPAASPPPGQQGAGGGGAPATAPDFKSLSLVTALLQREQREGALFELSKKRETYRDLAPTLWHSVGAMAALLQEVMQVYPLLSPPNLGAHASNRVCNALVLLQCIASHPDTRTLFLHAHIPLFLYPFLNTVSKTRPFEYLRLTSLGVIGALVKADDVEVIKFLLSTEIIPLCLRIMENGSELSKTVATFIVQKMLLFDIGLSYICATPERFYAVTSVLHTMVNDKPTARLLKHIVRCYLRLSDHLRAREALKQAVPAQLRDSTFSQYLNEDTFMRKWLWQLLVNLDDPHVAALQQQANSTTS